MRRLPILDDSFLDKIEIATPCTADWNQMAGDDRVRHCGQCRLNVYDISEMTRHEAAVLLTSNEGERTCLRLYKRPDGTLVTQDCWARLRAARRRGWVAFAAALVIVCVTQLGLRWAGISRLIRWYDRQGTVRTMGAIEPVGLMGAPVVPVPSVATPPRITPPSTAPTMGQAPFAPPPSGPKLMGARKR